MLRSDISSAAIFLTSFISSKNEFLSKESILKHTRCFGSIALFISTDEQRDAVQTSGMLQYWFLRYKLIEDESEIHESTCYQVLID